MNNTLTTFVINEYIIKMEFIKFLHFLYVISNTYILGLSLLLFAKAMSKEDHVTLIHFANPNIAHIFILYYAYKNTIYRHFNTSVLKLADINVRTIQMRANENYGSSPCGSW